MTLRAARALVVLLLVVPLFGQAPQPVGDQRFQALAARYFAELWQRDPIRATQEGVHEYDAELTDFSAAAFAARVAWTRRFLEALHEIDPASLGAEDSYDQRILEAYLETSLVSLQTLQPWRHDPSYYTSRLALSIYELLGAAHPTRARDEAILQRERAMPDALDAARDNVESVDPVTAEIARSNIASTTSFFANAVPAALGVATPALRAQIDGANAEVVAALERYSAELASGPFAHPAGTYAIGAETYAKLLALQELEPISLQAVRRAGEDALRKTESDFAAIAAHVAPGESPRSVADAMAAHPLPRDAVAAATGDIAALRTFVADHKLLSLPSDDRVKVTLAPPFSVEGSLVSLDVPGTLEKTPGPMYLELAPAEDTASAHSARRLALFSEFALPLVCAHEVMPGHAVNYALDRAEPLSLVRRLLPSKTFAEGWAHYAEQMIVDEGWGHGDPRVRLAQLALELQRECRYLVSLREHTSGMTVPEATRFFEDHAFLDEETARREALRGTQDPLYGYYTLGKLELLKLRTDFRKSAGAEYGLSAFHDRLLAHGDPPIAIARKEMLGADDDGKLL